MRTKAIVTASLFAMAMGLAHDARASDAPAAGARAADTQAEARTHFARAVELYEDGEYKLARVEFERSYALSSNFRVLYNIGQVEMQLGAYAKAFATLERYLVEGKEKITPERLADVKRDLGTLTNRTAILEVDGVGTSAGAEVTLDDVPIGKLPLPRTRVNAGDHRFRVSKASFISQERSLALAGGDVVKITIALQPSPVIAVVPAPSITPLVIAWTSAGILAAGAATCGILGSSAASDLDALRDSRISSASEREQTANRASSFFLASDILAASAIVSGGIALFLTLRRPSASARTGLAVRPLPRVGMAGLTGEF